MVAIIWTAGAVGVTACLAGHKCRFRARFSISLQQQLLPPTLLFQGFLISPIHWENIKAFLKHKVDFERLETCSLQESSTMKSSKAARSIKGMSSNAATSARQLFLRILNRPGESITDDFQKLKTLIQQQPQLARKRCFQSEVGVELPLFAFATKRIGSD